MSEVSVLDHFQISKIKMDKELDKKLGAVYHISNKRQKKPSPPIIKSHLFRNVPKIPVTTQ